MRILLIEDDAKTAAYVANGLEEHGHVVDQAANGRDGLFLAAGESYDLLIVDRMLPGLDGLAVVKTIRGAGVKTPVLFLTTSWAGSTTGWKVSRRAAMIISSSPSPSPSSSPGSTRSRGGRR
jgi:DNA-binding response OmpR family regulator